MGRSYNIRMVLLGASPFWFSIVLACLTVPAVEWLRERIRRKQFSLADLLVATAYCAVAAALLRALGRAWPF